MLDPLNCKAQPKADLHVHLNGAIPTNVVTQLIQQYNVPLPSNFDIPTDLCISHPAASLNEYLKPWYALKLLPRGFDCLKAMTAAAFSTMAADNIRYVELRNSPFNIADLNNISLDKALNWILEAVTVEASKHDIVAKLVISMSRYGFSMDRSAELLNAIAAVNTENHIVGLDLSGDEDLPVPAGISTFFRHAKDDLGLGISIHAGETGNADNIAWAINDCKADRIAHALAAISSPHILELLYVRNICVETCLTTNTLTGAVKDIQYHPVTKFLEFGIPFVLCSDNPSVNRATLSDDYALFHHAFNRQDTLKAMFSMQKRFAFYSE